MRLYSGPSQQFISDTTQNIIAEKLRDAFTEYFRYQPGAAEIASWRNSLRAVKDVVQDAKLFDHGIMVEYQLPSTSKRLDFLVCGKDSKGNDQAVIVELKQWEKSKSTDGDFTLATFTGGGIREVLHPSVQVGRYAMYLRDMNTAFYEAPAPVGLEACSYLHNYSFDPSDPLFHEKFAQTIREYPVFTLDDFNKIRDFIGKRMEQGKGMKTLERIERSTYRPSKKLMEHVAQVIRGKKEYVLLDEQLVAYDRVMTNARNAAVSRKKSVILIKGGPGTGKSVIALNLMAELLEKGFDAQYATGSRAFTETLRNVIGIRGGIQFKYFNSYVDASPNQVDVLISDEAHRIRETSNNRFTKAAKRSKELQIDELLRAAKTSVFFIDDKQVVRPGEIGSSDLIRTHAAQHKAEIFEHRLEAQFRCNGSDAFVSWVNNTLGVENTPHVLWNGKEDFDFRIFESPAALEAAIREKVKKGHTGRMTAGFCWPWSKAKADGTLENDVVVGNYKRPWNARPEAAHVAKGIPKSNLWASDPNGIEQIGCVYTAQGFEFDYAGVIWGEDLVYDLDKQRWVGHPEHSEDSVVRRSKDNFGELVKNTYRVLLSRGMKGCYVCFVDKDTERFVKTRIQLS